MEKVGGLGKKRSLLQDNAALNASFRGLNTNMAQAVKLRLEKDKKKKNETPRGSVNLYEILVAYYLKNLEDLKFKEDEEENKAYVEKFANNESDEYRSAQLLIYIYTLILSLSSDKDKGYIFNNKHKKTKQFVLYFQDGMDSVKLSKKISKYEKHIIEKYDRKKEKIQEKAKKIGISEENDSNFETYKAFKANVENKLEILYSVNNINYHEDCKYEEVEDYDYEEVGSKKDEDIEKSKIIIDIIDDLNIDEKKVKKMQSNFNEITDKELLYKELKELHPKKIAIFKSNLEALYDEKTKQYKDFERMLKKSETLDNVIAAGLLVPSKKKRFVSSKKIIKEKDNKCKKNAFPEK